MRYKKPPLRRCERFEYLTNHRHVYRPVHHRSCVCCCLIFAFFIFFAPKKVRAYFQARMPRNTLGPSYTVFVSVQTGVATELC